MDLHRKESIDFIVLHDCTNISNLLFELLFCSAISYENTFRKLDKRS